MTIDKYCPFLEMINMYQYLQTYDTYLYPFSFREDEKTGVVSEYNGVMEGNLWRSSLDHSDTCQKINTMASGGGTDENGRGMN